MKFLLSITCLLLLNGCVQSTAFFGPAVTVASTGNIHQAGLSYASNKVVHKITGKTPIENVTLLFKTKEGESEKITLFKKKIKEISNFEDLSNQ